MSLRTFRFDFTAPYFAARQDQQRAKLIDGITVSVRSEPFFEFKRTQTHCRCDWGWEIDGRSLRMLAEKIDSPAFNGDANRAIVCKCYGRIE